jgi:putative transcriptional regulator
VAPVLAGGLREKREGQFEPSRKKCDGEADIDAGEGVSGWSGKEKVKPKNSANKSPGINKRVVGKRPTVGGRIVEGLEQALAWTRGKNDRVRVTLVQAPDIDIRKVRQSMGLSQAQFATKFGFPPATLRNWEQGRSRPDAPTRVLLAVIARHPEAVEDVLRKAG